jgi:hypothetical protein
MTDMHLTADEEYVIRRTLSHHLPMVCRHHGTDWAPPCESCRTPRLAQEAWRAFTAARDRRDDLDAERRVALHRLAGELRATAARAIPEPTEGQNRG